MTTIMFIILQFKGRKIEVKEKSAECETGNDIYGDARDEEFSDIDLDMFVDPWAQYYR